MLTDTLRLASDLAQRGEPFALLTVPAVRILWNQLFLAASLTPPYHPW